MIDSDMIQDFEVNFRDLLEGAEEQFKLGPAIDDPLGTDQSLWSDIDRLQLTENELKESIRKTQEEVDQARQSLQLISREFESAQQAVARTTSAGSDSQQHQQKMHKATLDRVADMKKNGELDHALSKAKNEVEQLKRELGEEEADPVEVAELDSEVLRIKMYRDFGYTPVEENGVYKKLLIRSSQTNQASTVALDSKNDFWITNFVWDTRNS